MPTTTGCADHCGRALEQDAEHLPQRGDCAGQREARLGGPVSGTPADDGCTYTRGEQVCSEDVMFRLRACTCST